MKRRDHELRYVLAVLSHGYPQSDTAERCLDSFVEHVTPMPAMAVYRHDGPGHAYLGVGMEQGSAIAATVTPREQLGFCGATRGLWRDAITYADLYEATHVFWLEHDFLFTRRVDLVDLALALDAAPTEFPLAQMSLMRGAVNERERSSGVLAGGRDRGGWLEHRSYFTTNPSLMTAEFMEGHPFPEYASECEGRFGIDLVAAGFSFGVWGDGEPWTEHIGIRSGRGY